MKQCKDCGANLDPGERCGCKQIISTLEFDVNATIFFDELTKARHPDRTELTDFWIYKNMEAGKKIVDNVNKVIKELYPYTDKVADMNMLLTYSEERWKSFCKNIITLAPREIQHKKRAI